MSQTASFLRDVLARKAKEPGNSLKLISEATGIGYFKLVRFHCRPDSAPFQLNTAEKLCLHLTGKTLSELEVGE